MRTIVAVLALALAGCPICSDGELRIVAGADPVAPGGTVSLELHYDSVVFGPGHCGGHWSVDDLEGGSAAVGTIDTCGQYLAPAVAPDHAVRITAAQYGAGACADCCPSGSRTLTVR
jgi:hypothetical protein